MYRFLAPVLSAQFITAATGMDSEVRNLLPAVAAFLPMLLGRRADGPIGTVPP